MWNLDRQKLSFQCPRCHFWNSFFFRQARLRDVIICRGCKANIRLDDQMNECHKAESSIRKALQELETAIKGASGKITLKL